jgi:hypothetical protein
MRKLASLIILFCGILVASQRANALIDLRLSYGLLTSATDLSPLCTTCTTTIPGIVPTYGLGGDLLVTLPIPLIPGVGIRYENMGLTASSGGLEFKSEFTRTALMFTWRPINNFIYFGPTFTYGLSHSTNVKAVDNGVVRSNFNTDSVDSYSASLEAGLNLLGFSVGAEAGYMYMKCKDAKDATGLVPTQTIDMSGPFAKILLGISI